MKSTKVKLCFLLALAFAAPVLVTSCAVSPKAQVYQVQTLKTVGQIAESALVLSAQLYGDKKITAAQAVAIATFYDAKFQPAFGISVMAAKSDLSSIASPDVILLASQLAAMVAQYQTK